MSKLYYKIIICFGFFIILILATFLYFHKSTANTYNPNSSDGDTLYISGVSFFIQAPKETTENWMIHENSCEEASMLLYTSYLQGKIYDTWTFEQAIFALEKQEKSQFWKEMDLKKIELKDFINSYFHDLQVKIAYNLDDFKIWELLQDGKPILVGIDAKDIENPYYHYSWYHTLLIVWATKEDYIVKDVGTKHGNDWKYPKEEILKAINHAGNWGIIIERVVHENINNDAIDSTSNHSTYQSKTFYNDLILSEKCCQKIELPSDIKWGIISHHLFVAPYFDNYFRVLREQKKDIKTFILVGTNHFNFDHEIYTTDKWYITPFGMLDIDKELAQKLMPSMKVNNKVIVDEHSIHSIVGFIKKYYPDAKIVPIIINDQVSTGALDELSQKIHDNWHSDVFYLQSTDFSHYQPQYVTDFYDLYSKNVLDDFDISRVPNMWVDCKNIMYLTFHLLDSLGAKKHFLLKNSSSNNYIGVSNFQNTSHFFSYFGSGENIQKSNQVSLLLGGDMILNYDLKKDIQAYPFYKIDSFENTFFRGYDDIILNFEGNFSDKTYEQDILGWPIHFKFNQDWLPHLKKYLGLHAVFSSNNHTNDFGPSEILASKGIVEKNWLQFIGNSTGFFEDKNVYKRSIENKKLIVINLNDVVSPLLPYDVDLVKTYITEHKKSDTIVVVYMHWWREYELVANNRQIYLGHTFIDAGADLIVGSHTHTVQNKEIYKGKMIYYSLGNITFDSSRQRAFIPEVLRGMFLWVNFYNNTVNFFEIPFHIKDREVIVEEKIEAK